MKRKIALCLALMIVCLCVGSAALASGAVIKTNTAHGVVNLRSQGSAKKPVIGSVKNGASVEILYRGNYWDKVRVSATGQVGWVYKKYVYEGGSSSSSGYSGGSSYASGTVGRVTTKYSGSTVNVRYGPGTGYAVLAGVGAGTEVRLQSQSGNWYQVYIPARGLTGYISKTYVSLGLAARTTGNVNMRTGAGTDYSRLCTIPRGTNVTVLSVGSSWSQVSYNGRTGYIYNSYWTYR